MSAAGRDMGLSPAVVSKRISQLEERLGARLFQRTTRQLTLTETGAGYFKRVVDILSLSKRPRTSSAAATRSRAGCLKSQCRRRSAGCMSRPISTKFLERYPEIELARHRQRCFVDIIREGFDLAIRIGELEDSSLVARLWRPTRVILCAAPAYIEKHGLPATTLDLEAHNCLVADAVEMWKLSGPEGDVQVRPYGTSGRTRRSHPRVGVGGRRHRPVVDLGYRPGTP